MRRGRMNRVRIPVNVSTSYTGTRKRMGRWIKPRKMVVELSEKRIDEHRTNFSKMLYDKLKMKKSLKGKDFAWWFA